MNTNSNYSPLDQLPAPEPKTVSPPSGYFYENTAKHLIKDVVRVMMNGIPINLEKVKELEETLDIVLTDVKNTLNTNKHIINFQKQQYRSAVKDYIELQKSRMKTSDDFIKPFKHKDMNHRSYFMYLYAKDKGIAQPTELLPTGIPKWTARTVKQLSDSRPVLQQLLSEELSVTNTYVVKAMALLAKHKSEIYNKKYKVNIKNPTVDLPDFNPASSQQKRKLFDMLNIESEKISKDTGEPSWDRDEVEKVNKSTNDPIIKELTQAFIDYSFGAIVKNNFIKAFYNYTIDDRLYGSLKLFGAKSFRLTSSDPNLLNLPSTKSIYSKPVKQCFTAPEGYVIYAIDYSALEDRVIASLTRDVNKCNVFTEGLDGHCLNAYGYFKEEIAKEMPITGDTVTDVKKFFDLQEHGNKTLKAIRQKGKPATFGLSYGSYPPKVANTLKISLAAATAIFDRYHNELYSGITDYRENYVLPTATENGNIHMGLGCYINTDNPDRDIRTLHNATCQFWSILTLLAINKIHQLIDEAGLRKEIQCISTIYDSIYFVVKDDAETIKWLNDRIVPAMLVDFMEDQTIPNEAAGEIGYDWADMNLIPNEASKDEIKSIRDFTLASKLVTDYYGRSLTKEESSAIESAMEEILTCNTVEELVAIIEKIV